MNNDLIITYKYESFLNPQLDTLIQVYESSFQDKRENFDRLN